MLATPTEKHLVAPRGSCLQRPWDRRKRCKQSQGVGEGNQVSAGRFVTLVRLEGEEGRHTKRSHLCLDASASPRAGRRLSLGTTAC